MFQRMMSFAFYHEMYLDMLPNYFLHDVIHILPWKVTTHYMLHVVICIYIEMLLQRLLHDVIRILPWNVTAAFASSLNGHPLFSNLAYSKIFSRMNYVDYWWRSEKDNLNLKRKQNQIQ